jgi:hypothetical protein
MKKIIYRIKKITTQLIIYIRYSKKLKKFKDIHKGERCFVIGNGPSLTIQDLEKLKKEYTFASNKIYLVFGETNWHPTYYCTQDDKFIARDFELIKQTVVADNKFIAGNSLIWKSIYLPDWIYFFSDSKIFFPRHPQVSKDISKKIIDGFTITYTEIQLAFYMGFSEIYLLGIDHNYSSNLNPDGSISTTEANNHFYDKNIGSLEAFKDYYYPVLEYSSLAYESAKKYADANGIKIENATRGGKLEVFKRVNFDSLFK